MRDLPTRKNIRLKGYDYTSAGCYFITICVKDKHELLWEGVSVGAACGRPPLSAAGSLIENEINGIEYVYDNVKIDKHVIMPNHVHLLIRLSELANDGGRPQAAPTISRILNQFKSSITKKLGYSIWQKLFHDHIVRNEEEYQKIWKYIDENPAKWVEDCYYTEPIV